MLSLFPCVRKESISGFLYEIVINKQITKQLVLRIKTHFQSNYPWTGFPQEPVYGENPSNSQYVKKALLACFSK